MTGRLPKHRLSLLVGPLLGFMIFLIAGSVFFILHNKEQALHVARIKAQAQVQLLGENASSALYAVDAALMALLPYLRNLDQISDNNVAVLFRSYLLLPQIKNILIFDAQGELRARLNTSPESPCITCPQHRDAWLDFAAETIFTETQGALIVMSRRIETPAGEFAGVLMALIDPSFFHDRYAAYLNIDADALLLSDLQGIVLMGWFKEAFAHQQRFTGIHIRRIPLFDATPENLWQGGGIHTYEDEQIMIATYQFPAFPFYIAAAYLTSEVLRAWRRETYVVLGITSTLTILTLCAMAMTIRQLQRREAAEIELGHYQQHLEDLVHIRTHALQQEIAERIQIETALREREALFHSMFNMHSAVMLLIDPDNGRIFEANQVAASYYGYSLEELRIMSIYAINQMNRADIDLAMLQARTKQRNDFEFRHRLANGDIRAVEVHSAPITWQQRTLLFSIIHDITDRKQAEDAVQQAKEQAEAAERIKSTFFANVSHHLRTPLNVILGFADLMADDATLSPTYQEYLALIRQNGKDLLTLINQMLKIAKLHPDELSADESARQLFGLLENPTPQAVLATQAETILTEDDIETLRRRVQELPEDARNRLAEATQNLDFVLMSRLIAQLRQTQPVLAAGLERLARNFEYENILALLENKGFC